VPGSTEGVEIKRAQGTEAAPTLEGGWMTCDSAVLRSEDLGPTPGGCHTIPESSWLLKTNV